MKKCQPFTRTKIPNYKEDSEKKASSSSRLWEIQYISGTSCDMREMEKAFSISLKSFLPVCLPHSIIDFFHPSPGKPWCHSCSLIEALRWVVIIVMIRLMKMETKCEKAIVHLTFLWRTIVNGGSGEKK